MGGCMMSVPPRGLSFSASLNITQHFLFFSRVTSYTLTIECLLTARQSSRVCLRACVHILKEVEVEVTVTRLQKKRYYRKELWYMNRTNVDIMYN